MVAKILAAENIRQMHLDHRQLGGVQRVEDRHRGMRQRAGIEDDAVGQLARLLDPIDQLPLVVRLAELDRQIERVAPRDAALFEIGQRVVPVGRRLAHPEQVQIGAVQNKNGRQ